MKYRLFYTILGLLGFIGCDDSESLSPTLESESVYSLPQGNHDYDARIVDWHERCGFYILYKFEPRDLYYNLGGGWLEMTMDTLSRTVQYVLNENAFDIGGGMILVMTGGKELYYMLGENVSEQGFRYKASIEGGNVVIEEEYLDVKSRDGGFQVEQPDEEYVGKQLEWLESMFFNLYQDTLLQKLMPLKVILGKNLMRNVSGDFPEKTSFYSVSNVFVLSHGDKSIESMSLEEKRRGKEDLNKWFLLEKLYEKVSSEAKAAGFFGMTNYAELDGFGSWSDTNIPYDNGILNYGGGQYFVGWGVSQEQMKVRDLKSYIMMAIDYSTDELNNLAENGDYTPNDCTGIFDTQKDRNGLIRDKYDMLVECLRKMGIDLKGIGDMYH